MRRICFAVLLASILPGVSYPCSCLPTNTPSDEYQLHGVVFIGTVIAIEPNTIYYDGYLVTLRVVQRWKGAPDSETKVWTAADPTACGFPFELDSTYLVYADAWDSTRSFTSWCTRTCIIQGADEDLTFLNTVNSVPTLIESSELRRLTINGYPNPANPTLTLRYSVPNSTMINVSLYSVAGELIEVLYEGISRAGASELEVNASRLSSGVYFARIASGYGIATVKLSIIR
jgi:hypothetical protein